MGDFDGGCSGLFGLAAGFVGWVAAEAGGATVGLICAVIGVGCVTVSLARGAVTTPNSSSAKSSLASGKGG